MRELAAEENGLIPVLKASFEGMEGVLREVEDRVEGWKGLQEVRGKREAT